MHLTRKEASKKLPIPRKGTKYVARAKSNLNNAVTVVLAIRDMLKLAKSAKEVRKMIHNRAIKINGREVTDYRQTLQLFNILQADKKYELSLLPTGKYVLVPAKGENRLCKVINKRLVGGNKIQLNMHDGTNLVSDKKIEVNDSVYLDSLTKIKDIIKIEKGKSAFIIVGKYSGNEAKIIGVDKEYVSIEIDGKKTKIKPSTLIVR